VAPGSVSKHLIDLGIVNLAGVGSPIREKATAPAGAKEDWHTG
jgi:hypothetical protein